MESEYSKAWNTSSGVSSGAQAAELHAQLHQKPTKQHKVPAFKKDVFTTGELEGCHQLPFHMNTINTLFLSVFVTFKDYICGTFSLC
jgi:hypothetical protein